MTTMHLEEQLARVRAGRANVAILDGIKVESYGSKVPLNQVANVSTPDPRTIAIKPWDKSMFRVIEKALIDSTIGIMTALAARAGGASRVYISDVQPDYRASMQLAVV